jgi:hypothetical protein
VLGAVATSRVDQAIGSPFVRYEAGRTDRRRSALELGLSCSTLEVSQAPASRFNNGRSGAGEGPRRWHNRPVAQRGSHRKHAARTRSVNTLTYVIRQRRLDTLRKWTRTEASIARKNTNDLGAQSESQVEAGWCVGALRRPHASRRAMFCVSDASSLRGGRSIRASRNRGSERYHPGGRMQAEHGVRWLDQSDESTAMRRRGNHLPKSPFPGRPKSAVGHRKVLQRVRIADQEGSATAAHLARTTDDCRQTPR